jgi:hypothetical protein
MSCILRQCEVKSRTASDFAFSPDAAAMAMDDALHVGEANASTLELTGRVQPLEDGEQFARVVHVEAGSIVADETDLVAVSRELADLDAGLFLL